MKYGTLAESILADYQAEAELTKTVLEAVPEDKLGFQPHEKSWTLGRLAGHVAEGPSFCGAMTEPELDFASGGSDWKPFEPTKKAEILAKLDEVSGQIAKLLAGRDDAFMNETWTMRAGEKVIWQVPRHVAMRSMAIHHSIHHRGQLEVYLRLVDAIVPPIYGPTADVTDLF
jgi:uncharacterized damage-inducible protein DinB